MTPCDAVSLRWPLPAADLPPLVIAGGGHLPLLSHPEPSSMIVMRGAPSDVAGATATGVLPDYRVFGGEFVAYFAMGVRVDDNGSIASCARPLPFVAASPAASAARAVKHVARSELVSSLAVRPRRILAERDAATDIFRASDRLEMVRVNAIPNPAKVVNMKARRDRTNERLVSDTVDHGDAGRSRRDTLGIAMLVRAQLPYPARRAVAALFPRDPLFDVFAGRAHAASVSKFRRTLASLEATERPPSVDHRGAIDESLRRSPFGTAVKRALNSAVNDLRGAPPAAGGE